MKKNILLLPFALLAFAATSIAAAPAKWETSFDVAQKLAKKTGKPILLDVSAVWCGSCHKLDKLTYKDAKVDAYLKANTVPVRLDFDKPADKLVANKYGVSSLPAVRVITPDGKLVGGFDGFKSVPNFLNTVKPWIKK